MVCNACDGKRILAVLAVLAVLALAAALNGCTIPDLREGPPGYIASEATASIEARFVVIAIPYVVRYRPMRVYYARLDPERNIGGVLDLRGASYYASAYLGNETQHLIDLPPGDYVAVMCSHNVASASAMSVESPEEAQSITENANRPWSFDDGAYNILFSSEIMNATRVRLAAGQSLSTDVFFISGSRALDQADAQEKEVALHLASGVYAWLPNPFCIGCPQRFLHGQLDRIEPLQERSSP